MNNLKFSAKFIGQDENAEGWKHFKWSILINDVSFEYSTGIGHFTRYAGTCNPGETVHDNMYKNNKKPVNGLAVNSLNGWVHVPEAKEVLECLFLDESMGSESFNDFCDNSGLSNDSLKALDIYRACMSIAPKLRKALGNDYARIKSEIENQE